MKKVLCLLLMALPIIGNAQKHACGSDILLQNKIKEDTATQRVINIKDARIRHELSKLKLKKNIKGVQQLKSGSSGNNFVIPVVVYIVHKGTAIGIDANITESRVEAQIDQLNDDFSSYGFQFCLATTQGTTTLPGTGINPGIIRVNDAALSDHDMLTDETSLKATSTLSSSKYLRIWVVNDITGPGGLGVGGYGTFPGVGLAVNDGIVMEYSLFGDQNSITYPWATQGKVLAHEVGHWLDLYHTFQGGCGGSLPCNMQGDRCCDTPPVAVPNSGCPVLGSINSCLGSGADLTDNHMDYTHSDCHYNFTADQEARMVAAINTQRSILVSNSNLAYTGVSCTNGVIAAFYADNYNPCFGNSVTYTATTVSGATYSWDFGDGSGTVTGNPVSHTHSTSNSAYTITLTVTSGSTVLSETQEVYVSTCTPILNEQSNWYFGHYCSIDFSTGEAVSTNTAWTHQTIKSVNPALSVSDNLGNLIFYTEGVNVWNNSHTLTASGLTNSVVGYTTDNISYVKNPSNLNQYYIFVPPTGHSTSKNLQYFVLDNTANVVVPTVTIPKSTGVEYASRITIIPHCNGVDQWVVTVGKNVSKGKFFVNKLTSTGVTNGIGSSQIPDVYPSSGSFSLYLGFGGGLKVSPDGSKLIVGGHGNRGLALYDFDQNTGEISNEKMLFPNTTGEGIAGCSFSPSGKYIYASHYKSISGFPSSIYRFDLDGNQYIVGEDLDLPSGGGNLSRMQVGPDGKLYIVNGSQALSCIPNPDDSQPMYISNAVDFSWINHQVDTWSSIPKFTLALPPSQVQLDFHHTITNCDEVSFDAVQCAPSYSWNFDDPASGANNTSTLEDPVHTFSGPGTYNVVLNAAGQTIQKNIVINDISPFSVEISGNTQVCLQALENYSAYANPNWTYNWIIGGGGVAVGATNNHSIDIQWMALPGTVQLQVTDENGCVYMDMIQVTQKTTDCDIDEQYFSKIYSNGKDHNHYSIETVGDDAVIVGAVYPPGVENNMDIHVQKVDKKGNIIWEQLFDYANEERPYGHVIHGNTIAIPVVIGAYNSTRHTYILRVNLSTGAYIDMAYINSNVPGESVVTNDILYSSSQNSYYLAQTIADKASITKLNNSLAVSWSKRVGTTSKGLIVEEISGTGIYLSGIYDFPNDKGSVNMLFNHSGGIIWQRNHYSGDFVNGDAVYDDVNDRIYKLEDNLRRGMLSSPYFYGETNLNVITNASTSSPIINKKAIINEGHQKIYDNSEAPMDVELALNDNSLAILAYTYNDWWESNIFPYITLLDRQTLDFKYGTYFEIYNWSRSYWFHDDVLTFVNHREKYVSHALAPWSDGFGLLTYTNGKLVDSDDLINFNLFKMNSIAKTGIECEKEFDGYMTSEGNETGPFTTFSLSNNSLSSSQDAMFYTNSQHNIEIGCNEFTSSCRLDDITLPSATMTDCYRWYLIAHVYGDEGHFYFGQGANVEVIWDFGDGTTEISNNVGNQYNSGTSNSYYRDAKSHTFLGNKCSYNVCITANITDLNGNVCSMTKCFNVNVGASLGPSCPTCTMRKGFFDQESDFNTDAQQNINIYPNPTNNQLTIDFGEWLEFNTQVVLISIEGKIVWDENISGISNYQLDVSTLPKGIYFIQIGSGAEQYREKIIVQ